ncbi:MAG: transglutaminase-like domain-containing protein, partial [Verrucomicrobiota bacterium]
EFHKQCGVIVKDCKTATEAVQALNSVFFEQIKVKYGTKRKRANQSPKESIEQGVASCTGLSILLADACRSVGIPARVAGTAMWTQINGNHTWVEVWDGGWHFTGAAEPSVEGLDHGWFNENASKAVANDPVHAIWANTWTPGKDYFPLIWNLSDRSVFAVNVTYRYTSGTQNKAPDTAQKSAAKIHLRVLDDYGQRVVAQIECLDKSGKSQQAVTTKAGTADLNDMPTIEVQPATEFILRVALNEETRDFPIGGKEPGDTTLDLAWKSGTPVKSSQGK